MLESRILRASFNLRPYAGGLKTKVAVILEKGKESTGNGSVSSVILNPKRMVVYYQHHSEITGTAFNFNEEAEWKEGIISFPSEPLREVLKELKLWYGVEI